MTNPILIFVDETKFPQLDNVRLLRSGVTAEGIWEPIDQESNYSLIILSDKESFGDLAFSHKGSEPVMGVEHRSRPVHTYLPQLKAIVNSYEKTCEFNHISNSGPIFDWLQGIFGAANDTERKRWVEELVQYVQSQDRWGAITSFLMNEQIRALGGQPLSRKQLPIAAQMMMNHLRETNSVEQTVAEFSPSES